MKSLYEVLEFQETATADEIKAAYRRLARANHPDLNAGDKAKEERFKRIQAAYDVLGDSAQRADYDAKLQEARVAEAYRAEAQRNAAARAEAQRRAAAMHKTRYTSHAAPQHSTVANKSSTGGTDWGQVIAGVATLGLVAMAVSALAGGRHSRPRRRRHSYWDPSVQRYRSKDGRFRSS